MNRITVFFVILGSIIASGCVVVDPRLFQSPPLEEVVVERDEGWGVRDKLLLVEVSGMLTDEMGGLFSRVAGTTPAHLKSILRRAEKDPAIRGVVLRIDSPGGTVTASEQMAREIRLFRDRTGVPVYAHILGLGCSGAYYLAAACDEIRIQPAGITGSIGVIAVLPRYRRLADKIGYEEQVFKSGNLKDLGSGMRDMTEEEKAIFQAMIMENYRRFIDWILANRTAVPDRSVLEKLADGRIYTAAQARESGLVDGVNHLDETVQALKERAGVARVKVIAYSSTGEREPNLFSPSGKAAREGWFNLELPAPLTSTKPGLHYLWRPGD